MAFRQLPILLVIIFTGHSIISQQYEFHSENPFGIQMINETEDRIAYKMMFYDRDQDGDQDLFLATFGLGEGGGFDLTNIIFSLEYQENIGHSKSPEFGPRQAAYDSIAIPSLFFYPSVGDLNGDGQVDIVATGEEDYLSQIQHLSFYLSDGDSLIIFNEEDYDLDAFAPLSTMIPSLTDLDSDGDLDILLYGSLTTDLIDTTQTFQVIYAKNIGTPTNPEFLGWFNNPYGILTDSIAALPQVADIDVDGDNDIISLAVIDSILVLSMKENISTNKHIPEFSELVISPYGMPYPDGDQQFIDFNLIDLDGDEDLDLFIVDGGNGFTLLYYENTQCVSPREEIFVEVCEGDNYEGYVTSGTFLDTFSMTEGCDSIRTLHLTVHPMYDEKIQVMKCEGDTIFMEDQIITSSGNYIIMDQSINGCDSIIHVNAVFYMIDASISIDENILSVMDIYPSYQWLDCHTGNEIAGAVNSIFIPDQSGSYAVEIITAAGCRKTSPCVEVVISNTEMARISKDIKIYPNPSLGRMVIQNESQRNIYQIKVVDVHGKMVHMIQSNDPSILDLEELIPGVYLMLLHVEDMVIPKKIFKQ